MDPKRTNSFYPVILKDNVMRFIYNINTEYLNTLQYGRTDTVLIYFINKEKPEILKRDTHSNVY